MDKELRLKDVMLISFVIAAGAMAVVVSTDTVPVKKVTALIGISAWIVLGVSYILFALHTGFVASPITRRSEQPIMFWASVIAWSLIWLVGLLALCTSAWSLWSQTPNNAINADNQEQRSIVAPLLAAGYGER